MKQPSVLFKIRPALCRMEARHLLRSFHLIHDNVNTTCLVNRSRTFDLAFLQSWFKKKKTKHPSENWFYSSSIIYIHYILQRPSYFGRFTHFSLFHIVRVLRIFPRRQLVKCEKRRAIFPRIYWTFVIRERVQIFVISLATVSRISKENFKKSQLYCLKKLSSTSFLNWKQIVSTISILRRNKDNFFTLNSRKSLYSSPRSGN